MAFVSKLATAIFGLLALALWGWIWYSLQFYPFAPSPSIIYIPTETESGPVATPNNACFINGIWTLCPWPAPWQFLYSALIVLVPLIIVAIVFSALAGWFFYKGTKH